MTRAMRIPVSPAALATGMALACGGRVSGDSDARGDAGAEPPSAMAGGATGPDVEPGGGGVAMGGSTGSDGGSASQPGGARGSSGGATECDPMRLDQAQVEELCLFVCRMFDPSCAEPNDSIIAACVADCASAAAGDPRAVDALSCYAGFGPDLDPCDAAEYSQRIQEIVTTCEDPPPCEGPTAR